MKVDSWVVPITFCWWFNHYQEKSLKNAENRTLRLWGFFSGVVCSSVFKKCKSLMRYGCRLPFYILCWLPFVSGSLLMLYSVLIHTSLLINYSVYPLIRYSDRVNNCFAVLWDVACYQASSNGWWISLSRHCFHRLVDIQGSKHLVRLLAITWVFWIPCQKPHLFAKFILTGGRTRVRAWMRVLTHVSLPSPICVCTNRGRYCVV